jgi:hypothetical protein
VQRAVTVIDLSTVFCTDPENKKVIPPLGCTPKSIYSHVLDTYWAKVTWTGMSSRPGFKMILRNIEINTTFFPFWGPYIT